MRLTVWLSRPDPASANCVDAQGQIFGKGAMEWKVGTCSGHHTTALSGGEGARSQQYLILRYTNDPRYMVGGEAGHGALEHIEANGISRHEILVVKLFGEEDVQEACKQCRILAVLRLEMQNGVFGRFEIARIDYKQHAPVIPGRIHGLPRVDAGATPGKY